jgi:hypothetical protein
LKEGVPDFKLVPGSPVPGEAIFRPTSTQTASAMSERIDDATGVTRHLQAYSARRDEAELGEVVRKLEQRLGEIASWEMRRFPSVRRHEGEGTHAVRSVVNAALARLIQELRRKEALLDRHDFTRRVRQKVHDHLVDVHRYLFTRNSGGDAQRKPSRADLAAGGAPPGAAAASIDRRDAPMMAAMLLGDMESVVASWPAELKDAFHWMLEIDDPRKAPHAIADAEAVSLKVARRRVREVQKRIGRYFQRGEEPTDDAR